ncbi:MAG: radical SAM protein [Chloroflexi bacterium]|nr:radical SAM protein [Chloroflexota bacterium]
MKSNMRAPSTLFLEITTECNSRCRYCHMWALKDQSDSLSTNEKVAIINQFYQMNPEGEVVLTGGEPFLKKEEFFELVQVCRQLGLTSSTNTNGTLIEGQIVNDIACRGPSYIVFSLDSDEATVHDYHRGAQGSYDQTVGALTSLVSTRNKSGLRETEVLINTVVTSKNVGKLIDIVCFAEHLGVDGVTLQMLTPTFFRVGRHDKFFEDHFFLNKPSAINSLQILRESRNKFPILRVTDADLFWMQKYILDAFLTARPICNSHYRNLVVDHKGDVRLCFNMSKILDGRVLGNTRSLTLEDMWSGQLANAARDVMEECRLSCGILNCHRRQDLTC